MKIIKKVLLISLIFILAGSFYLWFAYQKEAKAQENPFHIKIEASVDEGVSWHNFSGSDYPGGEAVVACPGQRVMIRVKIWNTGELDYDNVYGEGSLTNSDYVADAGIINPNEDNDGFSYTGYYFFGGAQGIVERVPAGGSIDEGYESFTAYLILASEFPVGTTELVGTATVSGFGVTAKNFNLVDRALADSPIWSSLKIVVNNSLPQTGANL